MNIPQTYRSLLSISEAMLSVFKEETPIDIQFMEKGILFVMAQWSGASQLSFRALNDVLKSLKGADSLMLYVADTDYLTTQDFFRQIGESPRGAGEIFWVLKGKVVNKLVVNCKSESVAMRNYTEELVEVI